MSERRWAQDHEYTDHPAVKRAREALHRAAKNTPEKYLPYIMRMGNGVKVGGTKDNPLMKYVENPYMSVEGCMLWFYDDMQRKGTAYLIEPTIVECGGHVVVKTTITVHSTTPPTVVSDMASVNFGGAGVDRTNPIENASTSALGRALSRLGYGTFGGNGMATADEILEARAREDETDAAWKDQAVGSASTTATRPVSDKQRDYIRTLCEELGLGKPTIGKRLAQVETSEQASALIGQLQELANKKSTEDAQAQKAKRDATTALLAYAEEHSMTTRLNELMEAEALKLQDLTDGKAQSLHETLRAEVSEMFAKADLENAQAVWAQQGEEADADAQADLGLEDRRVPDMARRKG